MNVARVWLVPSRSRSNATPRNRARQPRATVNHERRRSALRCDARGTASVVTEPGSALLIGPPLGSGPPRPLRAFSTLPGRRLLARHREPEAFLRCDQVVGVLGV